MTGAELVGQNIRRLRRARGLKQTALAELCGYSSKGSGTISKIEGGQMVVDISVAERIARALEVDPTELFLRREEQTLTSGGPSTPAEMQCTLLVWQALGTEERQTLQRAVELLASGTPEIRRRLAEQIDYISTWKEYRGRQRRSGGAGGGDTLAG